MAHTEVMMINLKPLTREKLAQVTGGLVAIFDCLECSDGVYCGDENPHCSCCGAPMPGDLALAIRTPPKLEAA